MGWHKRLAGWLAAAVFFMYGFPGHVEDGQWWLDWWHRLMLAAEGGVEWLWWNYAMVAAGVLLALYALLPAHLLQYIARTVVRLRVSDFDVPIRDAIHHLGQTVPHSFRDSSSMERHFFDVLHREMCADRLPIIGMKGEAGLPKRISARQCKRLTPTAVVVPCNPSTPYGIRFSLMHWCKEGGQCVGGDEFLGLRVRGHDLYRLWPR